MREAIRAGQLRAGLELPSTRNLASELGVSRGVVVEVYSQLRAEGYLDVSQRGKTRVAQVTTPGTPKPGAPASNPASIGYDFHPGHPDLLGFPRAAWARALRKAVRDVPANELSYSDLSGTAVLREALAAHLSRARGALATADRVLITQGFTQGLVLVCHALRARGVSQIAVEDPCLPTHRAIAHDAGMRPVPVPVDDNGIDVDQLRRHPVGAVLLTPAHQFPMGAVLAPERRTQLIRWAREKGAYIIEDDYDAEYRYDREPVGTLQGLAPERVIYGGSASKTLAPALRLGWLLLPDELFGAVLERKAFAGASPTVEQYALADWLTSGEIHHHLRRMRLRYRRRRSAMIDALGTHMPDARLQGIAAGLHVVVHLPAATDEQRLAMAAQERGVSIHPLGWHRAISAPAQPGLVLGYANVNEASIGRGIEKIANALESIRRDTLIGLAGRAI